ncbi:MAG: Dynamin family protein [uncultured Sulfurovum sp.]|uniref:Dynamin family protein n=1 Tax=uncultured Sulfurovum sp. TaxID=269237 RepID=A0A6S6TN27_9BACT|nr:MAG: Dynamin family protein [uncultured Sulfurovum sp.]
MINVQKNYLNYLKKINNELSIVNIEHKKTKNFEPAIKNIELLIPIIGAFSAGKSSLINSFLGKNYLPVKITPETALATELRYSEQEYIEAVNSDNTITKFAINEIEQITKVAHQFKFLRMFITNKKLKDIEPLILVDMPGFESPLDLHNQAIMEYINKGVHYIVLTSVEDGTITRSMVRQLTDIQEYGRDFSFFLSKTNLRANSESQDVAENLEEQIEEYFDIEKEVVLIDDNGGESLNKILLEINPETLFQNLFLTALKDNYYDISEILNITISSLSKDKKRNSEVIAELNESYLKVQDEREKLIDKANERYSNANVNKIVEAVGRELSNNLEELINSAINNGQDGMSHLISEITRHVLITNIKDSMSDISDEIVNNLSNNLTNLNSSMSEFTMSDNWLEKITDTTKNMLGNAKGNLDNIINERNKSENNDKMYKVITTILATTTTVLAPIVELIIIFLPQLLGGLFENHQKKKQEEQLRNTILTQVIPSLKRELRSKLPKVFNEQVQEMIKNISNQFETVILEKKQTIEATQQEIDNKNIDIEKQINIYKEVNTNITTLTNNTLYK